MTLLMVLGGAICGLGFFYGVTGLFDSDPILFFAGVFGLIIGITISVFADRADVAQERAKYDRDYNTFQTGCETLGGKVIVTTSDRDQCVYVKNGNVTVLPFTGPKKVK